MIKIKELINNAKESKQGCLELIVGIWSLIMILILCFVLFIAISYSVNRRSEAGNKNNKNQQEETASSRPTEAGTNEPQKTEIPKEPEDPLVSTNPEETDDIKESEKPDKAKNEKGKEENVEEIVYATDIVNMRSFASTNATILDKLEKGFVAARLEKTSDGWSKIYYNGQVGYVKSEFLTKNRPKEENVSSSSNINDYSTPSSHTTNTSQATKKPTGTNTATEKPSSTTKPTKKPSSTTKPSKKPVVNENKEPDAKETPEVPYETEQPVDTEVPSSDGD